MPGRKTTKAAAVAAAAMLWSPKQLIDQFVTGPTSAEAVNAVSMAFKKALIERAAGAEPSHHLGDCIAALQPRRADGSQGAESASRRRVATASGRSGCNCTRVVSSSRAATPSAFSSAAAMRTSGS
jgi:putative transposase